MQHLILILSTANQSSNISLKCIKKLHSNLNSNSLNNTKKSYYSKALNILIILFSSINPMKLVATKKTSLSTSKAKKRLYRYY